MKDRIHSPEQAKLRSAPYVRLLADETGYLRFLTQGVPVNAGTRLTKLALDQAIEHLNQARRLLETAASTL